MPDPTMQGYATPDFGGVQERLRRLIQEQLRVTPPAETFTPRSVQTGRLAQMVQQQAPDVVARLTPAQTLAQVSPASVNDGRYTLAEIGNAAVDHSPTLFQRIQQGLGSPRVRGAVAGLAGLLDPTAHGAEGFLGSAANAFTLAGQYQDRAAATQAAQAQAAIDKALQRRNIESEIAARDRERTTAAAALGHEYIDDPTDPTRQLAQDIDPRTGRRIQALDFLGRPITRLKTERPEVQPEWKRLGYPSFEAWDRTVHPPQEGERRAAGLLAGARQAYNDVQAAVQRGFSPNAEPAVSQALGTLFNNQTWRNATASPLGQQYYTAIERLFTNYLYTVSGAQVPPAELANQARQATTAFFDSPATRDQKMASLRGKLHEMEIMAGRDLGAAGVSTPDPVP